MKRQPPIAVSASADCIPPRKEFFTPVDRLDGTPEQPRFDRYAELKSTQHIKDFEDYPTFLSVLRQIKELRCPSPCRQGGRKPQCEVRDCVQRKLLNGCSECEDRPKCSLLDRLRHVHPDLDHHLDLIAEMGPEQCFKKGGEHICVADQRRYRASRFRGRRSTLLTRDQGR